MNCPRAEQLEEFERLLEQWLTAPKEKKREYLSLLRLQILTPKLDKADE